VLITNFAFLILILPLHLKSMEDRKEGELHLELKAMPLNRFCFKICFSEQLAGRCYMHPSCAKEAIKLL
jgi:hypothetical protein